MMKHLKIGILLAAVLSGCQKKASLQHAIWRHGQDATALNEINKVEQLSVSEITYQGKLYKNYQQVHNGKTVVSSTIKKIYNSDQEIVFAEAAYVRSSDLKNITRIDLSDKNELRVKRKISDLHSDAKVDSIKVREKIIFNHNYNSYYAAQFVRADGRLSEVIMDQDLLIIDEQYLGSQLATVDAAVYTLGPKFSQLTDILLQVEKSPMIANSGIFVDSQSENKISSIGSVLKFDPKDEKFEQVQVFYYLDKLQKWVLQSLNINFTSRIDAEVNVGYPAKTNTAFYFQNKIRLGRGDDVYYANMAFDPSIVFHEGFHALVDGLANLPFQGEGGSINEGYADFYTCVMLNRPYLGETAYLKAPFKRTIKSNLKLSEINGGLYHDSGIISGLLWNIKEVIGEKLALELATATLAELNFVSQFVDFNEALLKQMQVILPAEKVKIVQSILMERGFKYE